MNVFFDVLGTLLTEEDPRPRAREAFLRLKEESHDLYLWSSGGLGYAAGAAELLGWRTSSAAASTSVRSRASRSSSPWTTTRQWWRPTAANSSSPSRSTRETRSCSGWRRPLAGRRSVTRRPRRTLLFLAP